MMHAILIDMYRCATLTPTLERRSVIEAVLKHLDEASRTYYNRPIATRAELHAL